MTTSDDKAGRKAKCPGCGEVITVPEPDMVEQGVDEDEEDGDDEDDLPALPKKSSRSGDTKTCPMCGAKNPRRATSCGACGEEFEEEEAEPRRTRRRGFEYAGFWLRFVAAFVDGIILFCLSSMGGGCVGFVMGIVLVAANNGNANAVQGQETQAIFQAVGGLVGILISWLYHALMESSAKQATLGKMAVGIQVCDLDGERISFGRATGRFFAKYLSTFTCLIGYIMAGFTEQKQALHDMVAGTLVIRA